MARFLVIAVSTILSGAISARQLLTDAFLRVRITSPDRFLIIKIVMLMSEQTQLIPDNTLITSSPEAGRQLAIKMARLVIKATQPDAEVRTKLRLVYAEDAAMLIAIGQTVAIEFATIAAANNYWR